MLFNTSEFIFIFLPLAVVLTQLYFDFSGYCDMAVGLGLLFNLRLPINFAAPFRRQHHRSVAPLA